MEDGWSFGSLQRKVTKHWYILPMDIFSRLGTDQFRFWGTRWTQLLEPVSNYSIGRRLGQELPWEITAAESAFLQHPHSLSL